MMEEKKITINGIECNYKISGNGNPVLILHGWPSSSDSWIKVQEEISKKGYMVICPDFPGFGKSQFPSFSWNLDDFKNFIIDFISALKINKIILIGHSFGGRVSIKIASNNENLIEKMILCDPAGIKINPGLKTSLILFLVETGKTFFSIFSFNSFKSFFKNILYYFLKNRDYIKTEGIMKETMKKVISEDLTHLLDKISIKTLLIWGKKDKMIPLKYAYVFKEKIKKSFLVIIEDSGHSPNKDNPLKLSEEILKFI